MSSNTEEEIELGEDPNSENTFVALPAPQGTVEIKHESIFILAAHNLSGIEIARELGISQPTVYSALNTELGAKRVAYHRELLFANKPIRQRIETLSRKAIDNMEEFLDGSKTETKYRIQATTYILDQNLGKAKQSIVHEGDSLLSVFMDKLSKAKDVTPENKFAASEDPIDNFVNEIVSDHVVGAKSNGKS